MAELTFRCPDAFQGRCLSRVRYPPTDEVRAELMPAFRSSPARSLLTLDTDTLLSTTRSPG